MSWSNITDMLDPRAQEHLFGRSLMLNDQSGHFRLKVPDGVQIVGFTPDMKVVAITEEKADGSVYTHLPSGMVDLREEFVLAAGREFAEETGYRFERLVRLVTAKQSSAHLIGDDITFVALGCVKDPDCRAKPDKSEKILKVEELAPEALKRKMQDDLLRDPTKSVSGRNSYASLLLAMTWAEKTGLFDKPVTEKSPLLVVIAGLPLAGKSTLGDALKKELDLAFCDIDRLREQVTGIPTREEYNRRWQTPGAEKEQELDMRIAYQTLHEGAVSAMLGASRNVIVAATYSRAGSQKFLAALAKKYGARVKVVLCAIKNATREQIEERMKRDDGKDKILGCASWADYQQIDTRYEPVTRTGVFPTDSIIEVDTSQPLETYLPQVLEFIRS